MTWVYLTVTFKNPQEKTIVLPSCCWSIPSSWTTSPWVFWDQQLSPQTGKKGVSRNRPAGRYYSHGCYSLISCFIEKLGSASENKYNPHLSNQNSNIWTPYSCGKRFNFSWGRLGSQWGLGGCMLIKWRSNKSSKVDRTIERSFETSPDGEISNWTNSSFKGKCGFIYITLSLWITRCS